MTIHTFESDLSAGACPQVRACYFDQPKNTAIHSPNPEAAAVMKRLLGGNTEVIFNLGETGSLSSATAFLTARNECVVCSDKAHIINSECGAAAALGVEIVSLETRNGKLNTDTLNREIVRRQNDVHLRPIKVIEIEQPTTTGLAYTLDELSAIARIAREFDCSVLIDGARIANAAVRLDCDIKNFFAPFTQWVATIGTTKLGGANGVALAFSDPADAQKYKYSQKMYGQSGPKLWPVSNQYKMFFERNLWKKNAEKMNKAAKLFSNIMDHLNVHYSGISCRYQVETNVVFMNVPFYLTPDYQKDYAFWSPEPNVIRVAFPWNVTWEEIDALATWIEKKLKEDQG
ncbi:beta-eliminating lyase-related protein [bacterium]|nr:beta-eliminating lyase-related protein [bacterium]